MNSSIKLEFDSLIYASASMRKKIWSLPQCKQFVMQYVEYLFIHGVWTEFCDNIDKKRKRLRSIGYDDEKILGISLQSVYIAIDYLHMGEMDAFEKLWQQLTN